ncbi:MAG: autotransporter adhesin family protein [Synergistaceae bacterium]|nr:autotransporter adhesin family protein [Synergistaceae bacterium]
MSGNTNNHGTFGTGGTLALSGSIWTVGGIAPLPEGFTIGSGQTLSIPSGATAVIRGSAVNSGTITIASGGTLLVYGTLSNAGAITNAGTLDNKGTINNDKTITNSGTFVNEQGAQLVNFDTINNGGTLSNYGSVSNTGTINNDGTIDNNGSFDSTSGTITGGGTVSGDTPITGYTSDNAALDITKGFVTVSGVNERGDLVPLDAQATMVEQPDGTWLITAPEGADLSSLALTFALPDGSTISPENGSVQDFSKGAVKYTVTAPDGSTKFYWVQVKLPGEAGKVAGTLIATNVEYWKFVQNDSGGGTVSFAIEMPLIDDNVRPDHDSTLSVELGAVYSDVQFNTTVNTTGTPVPWGTPVLQIAGTAGSQVALELLRVSCVYWETGGVEYYQNLTPVTYDEMNPNREGVVEVLEPLEVLPPASGDWSTECKMTYVESTTGIFSVTLRVALDLGSVLPSQITNLTAIFNDNLKPVGGISCALISDGTRRTFSSSKAVAALRRRAAQARAFSEGAAADDSGTYVDIAFDVEGETVKDALKGAALTEVDYWFKVIDADGKETEQRQPLVFPAGDDALALDNIEAELITELQSNQPGEDDVAGVAGGGCDTLALAAAAALMALGVAITRRR